MRTNTGQISTYSTHVLLSCSLTVPQCGLLAVTQGLTAGWEKRVTASLKQLVSKGKLVQDKAHWKLSAEAKKPAAAKKPKAAKKAAAPKKPKADKPKKAAAAPKVKKPATKKPKAAPKAKKPAAAKKATPKAKKA